MIDEWVMVPRDPTEAMFSASSFQEWDTFEQEWRAMLDAAPAAPVQQAEPVAWGQLGMMNGKTYLRQKYDREPYPPPPDVVRNLNLVPLWTNPPAAEVQRLREALEYLIEKCGDSDDAQYSTLGTKFVRDIARRALEGGE